MCCIPRVLEFCSSHPSVYLVLAASSCWSSGGGACCHDSRVSLPGQSGTALARGQVKSSAPVCSGSFCSLKAFPSSFRGRDLGTLPPQCALREKRSLQPVSLVSGWHHFLQGRTLCLVTGAKALPRQTSSSDFVAGWRGLPPSCSLSSQISSQICFSARPTLQKVVSFVQRVAAILSFFLWLSS